MQENAVAINYDKIEYVRLNHTNKLMQFVSSDELEDNLHTVNVDIKVDFAFEQVKEKYQNIIEHNGQIYVRVPQ